MMGSGVTRSRARLLMSACAVLIPAAAQAQNGQPDNTTITTSSPAAGSPAIVLDTTDTVTVNSGVTFRASALRAFNYSGNGTAAGPTINNNGTIISTQANQPTPRAIDASGNQTNRSITVNNNMGATIQAGAEAIRIANALTGAGAPDSSGSVINVNNAGLIESLNVTTNGIGVLVEQLSLGSTLNVVNATGGVISASRGIVSNGSNANITNNGRITASGANPSQALGAVLGAAIQVQGGANAVINLTGGSVTETTTTGADTTGNAIYFGGTGTHTVNVAAGATVTGRIRGSTEAAAIDILNLNGPGNGTLGLTTSLEQVNVNGGIWSTAVESVVPGVTTITAGATLRFEATPAGEGAIRGAIVNNGNLLSNRTLELTQAGAGPTAAVLPVISGTGNLQLTGTGVFALSANTGVNGVVGNTYSGVTLVDNGRLRGDAANAFSANSAVTVAAAGTVDLNGFDQTVANISGAGAVTTGTTAGATLTTGSAGGATVLSGVVSGLGGLTKAGTGTLTLSGANTATGLLRASGGALALTGSWAGSGQVDNGGTLTGVGTLAGPLTIADGGIVAPGSSGVGRLATGGLALSANSILAFDFGAPGTSDSITVNGNVTLDGTINVNDIGGFGDGVYRLIDYTGTLTDNGLAVGTLPNGADPGRVTIQTGIGQQINLIYGTVAAPTLLFWDGANTTANGVVDGGSGSWINASPNWTSADGTANTAWNGNFAVFQGAPGTVSVNDSISFNGLQFTVDGYSVVAGTGALSAGAGQSNIRVDPGVTATISAAIGGTGGLLKNDAGTLILGGANSYAGSTLVAGGVLRAATTGALPGTTAMTIQPGATLDIGASQAIGSLAGQGAVTLSGGSLTTGGLNADTSFAGVLSGTGGLVKTGTGMLTLSGANTHAGGTTVAAGKVVAGTTGALGTGDLSVAAGGIADLAGFAQNVGALSGAGQILLGTNGVLSTTTTIDSAFGGPITGVNGALTKAGSGTLTLSGTNGFTGAVAVNGGRLIVSGALSGAPTATIGTGATLELAADQRLAGLAGDGALVLTAARLTVTGSGTFAGAGSGTGSINSAGGGTFVLGGANTYTGDTVASAGTLLVNGSVAGNANATGTATIGGAGAVAGTLSIANGATLAPGANGVGTLTTGGLVLGSGSLLAYQLGAPGVAGASDRVQVNGNLTLDGTLNVADGGGFGQGVYRLLDYTGALTDNGLVVGALPSGFTIAQTTVQTSAANQVNLVVGSQLPEIQFWDGANMAANNRVDGGSGSWNNQQANWTNPAGDANFRWGGRFAVFQGAAGTVTVDDAITFTGMQFMTSGYAVTAGTGALTTGTAASAIRVDPNVIATVGAAIGGIGGIAKLDTGTLVLTGANSYAGATAVNGGVLRAGAIGALPGTTTVTIAAGATLDVAANQTIGNLAGTGAVTLSAGSLTTGGLGGAATYAGVISGSGGLTKAGAGTFTLAGANSYTGATNVNAGTLALATGGRLGSGALTIAAGATVNLAGNSTGAGALTGAGAIQLGAGTLTTNGSTSTSYTGVISGSGGLVKTGTGTLTLGGANTYTGLTTVAAGTLGLAGQTALPNTAAVQVDGGATLALASLKTLGSLTGSGSVTLVGALTLGAGNFNGVISGGAALTKTGTGTLTLGGTNTFTGATTVSAGQLIVNGSLTSAVTVAAGARLGGIGRITGLTLNGTLAPGNGIGTFAVNGGATFGAGSVFQVETNAAGQADLLTATGSVTIGTGSTVQVLTGGSTNYAVANAYPIITAGAVTGTFSGVTSDFAFLTPSLRYAANGVALVLVRNDQSLASIGQTPNQQAVAAAIGQQGAGQVYDAVVLANAATARTVFDTLSGEVHADVLTAAGRSSQEARNGILERLQKAPREGVALWLDARSAAIDVDGSDGLDAVDLDRTTIAGGIDATFAGARVGFGYRHNEDRLDLDGRFSQGDIGSDAGFVYVGADLGPVRFAGGASLAWHRVETDRFIGVSTLRATNSGRERGRTHEVFGEVSLDLDQGPRNWGPYAGLSAASTTLRGGTERGEAATALSYGRAKLVTTMAAYGLRASGPLTRIGRRAIGVSAEIGGRSYLDNDVTERTIRFASSGGSAFRVRGVDFGETALTTRIGLTTSLLGGDVGLGFNGQLGDEYRSYGGQVSGSWRF